MITFFRSVPITIQPIFWVMTIILAWPQSLHDLIYLPSWIAVVTVSLLIHEFGHALTAKAFGHRVHIELNGMGGLAHHDGPRLSLFKQFMVVLNGPLAGICLYWISTFILYNYGNSLAHPIREMLYMSIWVNLNWTLLNLLPVYPLDGGQMIRIVLQALFGARGVKFSIMLSMAVGACVCMYFLMEQRIYMATLFLFLTFESYKSQSRHPESADDHPRDDMEEALRNAQLEMRYGSRESAKMKLITIREESKKGAIFQVATQNLAELLQQQGQIDEAYELLQPIEKGLDVEALMLLHELTYRKGDLAKAIELGTRAFQKAPQSNTALLNAYAHASLGDVKSTVGWLTAAINKGLPCPAAIVQRGEFDKVRGDPRFQSVL